MTQVATTRARAWRSALLALGLTLLVGLTVLAAAADARLLVALGGVLVVGGTQLIRLLHRRPIGHPAAQSPKSPYSASAAS